MIVRPSPNFDARTRPVSMVVLHYTGMPTAEDALRRLTDRAARVSAHWVVDEDGAVVQIVPEEHRAWHAGVSRWRGEADVNSRSIGIEIVNPGHDHGYRPFPHVQIAEVARLVEAAMKRYEIAPRDVVGHSDVAPARKADPGELFPWDKLAMLGLATATPRGSTDPAWPDAAFHLALERYGYDIADPKAATIAFQRRFRPARVDGRVDPPCRAILFALLLAVEEVE